MTDMYQIKLKGQLDQRSKEWLEGFSMELGCEGETILTGPVEDQASLYGLLLRVRDHGIPLLAVNVVSDRETPSGISTNATKDVTK